MSQAQHLTQLAIELAGFACIVAALGSWASRLPPSLSQTLASDRLAALDGLRAFLAVGVLLSHAWTFHDFYFAHAPWDWPSNPYFLFSGKCAVAVFFMITSFLFWGKARAAGGLAPLRLYANRARRILPLYYCVCLFCIAVALASGGPWEGGLPALLREILPRLVPGALPTAPIGGLRDTGPLLVATWTLYYEAAFYLALPALALMAKGRRPLWLLAVSCAVIAARRLHDHHSEYWLESFWTGALVAEARLRRPGIGAALRSRAAGLAVLAAAIAVPLAWGPAMGPVIFGIISAGFAAAAFGNDFFGILTHPGARILGAASYSIYLLHLPVLYVLLSVLDRVVPVGRLGGPAFAVLTIALTAVVCALSLVSFAWIEAPWMASGKRRPAPA